MISNLPLDTFSVQLFIEYRVLKEIEENREKLISRFKSYVSGAQV